MSAEPKKEGEERRRRRRDEGGGEGGEEKRRRRRDGEGGGEQQRPEGERRRRREEAAKKEEAAKNEETAKKEELAKKEASEKAAAAAAAKPAAKPAAKQADQNAEKAPAKRPSVQQESELNITYTAFSRQRRALDKYEKNCTYDQLLDKLHSDQFLEIMGGKYQDRDHARRERERCKTADVMGKKASLNSSSAGIMTDFYTVLLQWGGVPVPGNMREIVDGMEKRYRAEKKAEKERREEEERRAAEAARAEVVEEIAPEEDEEDAYADDFENEEDTFDPNQAYINAQINLKMQAEYQQAQKSRKMRDKVTDGKKHKESVSQGIVLPQQKGLSHAEVLAHQKVQKEYDRQMHRAQEILQLVTLDCATYDMMEIQPVTEYELYIRNFGQSNTEQMATQLPDETEVDTTGVQTDEITMGSYAAQAPEDLGLRGEGTVEKKGQKRMHIDTGRLSNFVSNCGGVFQVLLDESSTGMENTDKTSGFCFSSSVTTLNTGKYIGDRGCTGVVFSRTALQYLVTIHAKTDPADTDTPCSVHNGVCLVWNINNPTTADKICVANGTVSSATFSPHNGYLLYAGSLNGSVYLWDLREPDYTHALPNQRRDRHASILRTPTYTTDHLSTDNHCCAVRRILPVGYNSILIGGKDTDASEQVATLDEMGNVNIWIAVEVQDKRAFEKDFGLSMAGRMRLFRSATVVANALRAGVREKMEPPDGVKIGSLQDLDPVNTKQTISPLRRGKKASMAGELWDAGFPDVCAYDLEFQPDDASQFLIASDNGYIIHSSRFGDGAVPSRYRSTIPVDTDSHELSENLGYADFKHGTHVMTLDYSATDNRLFLAGFNDGSIGLYKTGWINPIYTLDGFTKYPIIVARWSMTAKGVVWALDANSYLYMFDLWEDDPTKRNAPTLSQNCQLPAKTTSFANDFDFSSDEREPKIALSYTCGRVDLHVIKRDILEGRSPSSAGEWLNSLL